MMSDLHAVAEYVGGVQFRITARDHEIICDQPVSNAGEDRGMTPPELLLASLASCAGFYAAQYLRTRALPTDGLKVTLQAEKAAQPARLGSFDITVELPELEERHKDGVLRAVKACLIHNTLLHPPAIDIAIHTSQVAVSSN